MKLIANAKSSRKPRFILWASLVCGMILIPGSGLAAHRHHYRGHGPSYGYSGLVGNYPGGSYYRPYYFNNYSHFPYPTFGHATHGRSGVYRNYYLSPSYPRPEPRIYVFPQHQNQSGRSSGQRVMNIISMPPRHINEIYPGYVAQGAAEETEADVAAPMIPHIRPSTPEQAWEQLQEGDARAALSAFAGLASANAKEGLYKMGYGLAAALNGDKITAGYALRRALESQPDSVAYVPVTGVLKERLGELAAAYGGWVTREPSNLNARFLYAVMSHLTHDDLAARACIDEALELGDTSASMAELDKVVDQYLADRQGLSR